MLLIGSANRDAGKTELACRILRRFLAHHPVVAVKVTTTEPEGGSGCPRGGEGCGACSSFEGPFCLTDAVECTPGKDTARMREAGAERVLWLKVREDHLAEGARALHEALSGTVAVVESNRLRSVIDPDLFLMLHRRGVEPAKSTAVAVQGFADRQVWFDGSGFDLSLSALRIMAGRWQLSEGASGIVLAGGASRRMGMDKRALTLGGITLLGTVIEQIRPFVGDIILGIGDGAPERVPGGVRIVADRIVGLGPLMGLASCLAASRCDRNLVVACDLPEIPAMLVTRLLDEALCHDVAVPRGLGDNLEPLLAVYRRRLLPDADGLLAQGERRIQPLYHGRDVRFVDLTEFGLDAIPNLNTMEDARTYLRSRPAQT